ncbi:hypothetical protein EG831_10350 [bacterium]|nr:hypothetical protein [bacterium]
MAAVKVHAVIEAVRYSPQGEIELVRLYERRGATFSDSILVNRGELVRRLKSGKVIATGRRQTYQGSVFDIGTRVVQRGERIVAGDGSSGRDQLGSVPLF